MTKPNNSDVQPMVCCQRLDWKSAFLRCFSLLRVVNNGPNTNHSWLYLAIHIGSWRLGFFISCWNLHSSKTYQTYPLCLYVASTSIQNHILSAYAPLTYQMLAGFPKKNEWHGYHKIAASPWSSNLPLSLLWESPPWRVSGTAKAPCLAEKRHRHKGGWLGKKILKGCRRCCSTG